MTWRDMVADCFGVAYRNFAAHPAEAGRAAAAIKEAKEAGATREDFWKEMLAHLFPLGGGGVAATHVEEQRKQLLKQWPERITARS